MGFIDIISVLIVSPVLVYGSYILLFMLYGGIYLVFRQTTWEEYKKELKGFRLNEEWLSSTKKFFWFTYTPLFVLVVIFRLVIPLNEEKYSGYVMLSIIGYLLVLLFSGYALPKDSKAETNFKKICRELNLITADYEKTHPGNYLGRYYHYFRNFINDYEKSGKQTYKLYDEDTDFKRIAHILQIKMVYDLIISEKIAWDEYSTKCACNLFSHVAKASIKNGYIEEKMIRNYAAQIKKAIQTQKG